MKIWTIAIVAFAILSVSCSKNQNEADGDIGSLSNPATLEIAKEAYTFGIPLVLMDITRRQSSNADDNPLGGPENSFKNVSVFPDANFRTVVRPNADTYYSSAWLNLEKEPLILSVPDTKGRYYMMPMMDAYTNVFASPGKRTTGTKASNFFVSGPNWTGNVPQGMEQIKSPTNIVWVIGRTQVNSKEDGQEVVVPIQKQYKLTPLSAWGNSYLSPTSVVDDTVPKGDPNEIVKSMPIDCFFNYMNKLMEINPPSADDEAIMKKFEILGIGSGKVFNLDGFNIEVQNSMKQVPADFFAQAGTFFSNSKDTINGWVAHNNLGNYGTNYEVRAFVAVGGLGANLPEDALYPSCAIDADGNKLHGSQKYVIHFDKGQTPPANAFWSLTMYDTDGYMVKNPIDRTTIGDRSDLIQNEDGSIDIYIQHIAPEGDKVRNWLPSPEGDFNILLRVYWPKEEMIDGSWELPPVKRI